MKSKVTELGVFAIGVGAIFGVLGVVLTQLSRNVGPTDASMLLWLGTCFTFAVSGGLTLVFRNRAFVVLTTVLIVLGLGFDLLLALNIVKLVISGSIIAMVVKTAREALGEISSDESHASRERLPFDNKQVPFGDRKSDSESHDDVPQIACRWCGAVISQGVERCPACERPL